MKKASVWAVHPHSPEADRIAAELKIHPVVVSILLRRGVVELDAIRRFIEPSIHLLQDPMLYPGIHKACQIIQEAIRSQTKILVYGDYDVDGVTASAILAPVLQSLGADVQIHLPHRITEGYGLNIDTLREWMKKGIGLVITVDNGITSFDAVKFIKDSGAKAILVDHHIPKDDYPPADVIVSGALAAEGEKVDQDLAACGLAFKLAWALCGDFSKVERAMDLVALGTVADLAPVEGENRILLKFGLPQLAKTRRPGLRALMDVAGIHPNYVSYRDIAFGLGPRINAAGRMGSAMDAYRLLTTDNDQEAKNLANLLEAGNRERQKVEAEAYKEAVKMVEGEPDRLKDPVIVVASPEWHEGVLGIVAARLVERFRKPAIVISSREGKGKGSGRSVPGISIFQKVRRHEDLLEAFGGHAQACGLSIRPERVDEFRAKLNGPDAAGLADEAPEDVLWADAELTMANLKVDLLRDLEKLSPFGPGNPKPVFISQKMKLRGEPKKRGKDTLQCWLSDASSQLVCEAIGFRAYERWNKEMKGRRDFDIAYQPALKNSNGIISIELMLEAWR